MDKQPYLKPGYYRDLGGSSFQVFGLVRHSETLDWLVVCGRNKPEWTQNWNEFYKSQMLDGALVPQFDIHPAL